MIPGVVGGGRPAVAQATSDPFWGNVTLLAHFDGSGSTFTDEKGNTLTTSGGGSHSSTQKLFGSTSMYSTSAATVQVATSSLAAFNLSGQFTVEFSVYLTTATQQYFAVSRGSATLSINTSGGKIQAFIFGTTITDPNTYAFNTWTRVRLTRDASNICRLFVNGLVVATSAAVTTNQTGTTLWEIGGSHFWGGGTGGLRDGYMDEFRITSGVCRSTTDYSLDGSAFPNG